MSGKDLGQPGHEPGFIQASFHGQVYEKYDLHIKFLLLKCLPQIMTKLVLEKLV